jgi:hypothetical protein
VRLGRYIKKAFLNHWNLLVVGAGTVFAFLTRRPDVVLPLVAAGEIAYLGMLGTHPKFQHYVDAQEAKATRHVDATQSQEVLDRILRTLPRESLQRYAVLRARAIELRQIATELRPQRGPAPFEDLQLQGLDRLLWIFVRLLHTRYSIERFLERTGEDGIKADVKRLEKQLADLPPDPANPRREKARQTVEDNLQTSRARLANLAKARENHEMVGLEIDRLENKIRSLAELAVNRQEPDFISDQVDAVAESMLETERTMNELQFATGLSDADEAVPPILDRPTETEQA